VSDIYDLVAHLDEFDGTLVRRGTPVEKHCDREMGIFTNPKTGKTFFSQQFCLKRGKENRTFLIQTFVTPFFKIKISNSG
jgi:hypothetical protein